MDVTLIFFSALGALALLLAVKHWERKRGAVLAAGPREKLDTYVVNGLIKLENGVRNSIRYFVHRVIIRSVHTITLYALHVVRFLEQQLVAFITLIRGRHGRTREPREMAHREEDGSL
jgi:hypothetical protein